MIIKDHRDDVQVVGAITQESFTIKASAKAFQILSSNLYSNPLGAVIRELSTNAYDAHVMVDKRDEPFVLTVPNSLNPVLIIRDFGPGLSEREVMSVYTTFFESTKTNTNDAIGCLGLGSKSPFGISDSFTITSYQNGRKTVYSAFLNETRIPTISKFFESETDEETGIEIEVAVKEENFSTVAREVNTQLKYFTVKPIIKGDSSFKWNPDEEYLYEGTGWKMVAGRSGGRGARVIQGQISYPIDTNAMGKHHNNASAAVKELLVRNILFTVNIGDVNIAPSREALTYDDQTCLNIIAAANKILAELPQIIKEKIQSAETEYEARLLFNTIMGDLGTGYYNKNLVTAVTQSGKILWKGKDVSNLSFWVPEADVVKHTTLHRNHNGRYSRSLRHVQKTNGYNAPQQLPDGKPHWSFEAKEMTNAVWVLVTDIDKAVEARVKQYVSDHRTGNAVTVNLINTQLSHTVLASRLGLKPNQVVIAANLPKVRVTRTKVTSKSGVVTNQITLNKFNRDTSRHSAKATFWEDKIYPTITDAVGYYVELNRYDVMNEGKPVSEFYDLLKVAVDLGIIKDTDDMFGLRKTELKMTHNLVNFFDTLKAGCLALNPGNRYEWGSSTQMVRKLKEMSKATLTDLQQKIDATSPLNQMINAILTDAGNVYSYNARKLIESYGIDVSVVDLSENATEIDNRYPLVRLLGYSTNYNDIAQYVKDIDELHTLRTQCASCTKV
jgi:hypothetical protein